MTNDKSSEIRSTWRVWLDTAAAAAMIVASVAVTGDALIGLFKPVAPAEGPVPVRPENTRGLPTPSAPQGIEDAAFEGSETAEVALVVYSDFQCPFCASFAKETWPKIRDKYVSGGRLLFVFRHLPIQSLHPHAFKAAESAECARQQGKFWQMHDELFADPRNISDVMIEAAAERIGLKDGFQECVATGARPSVLADQQSAATLRITGTPTFLLGRVLKDRKVQVSQIITGAQPFERFDQAIAALLNESQP